MPADRDADAFVRAVQDAEVALVGLIFFAGDMPGGDRGRVSWPARSTGFRDNLDVTARVGGTVLLDPQISTTGFDAPDDVLVGV